MLRKSAGWTCHAVWCLQFKIYGQHPRYINDTCNKTCTCDIMESTDNNANNGGCLRVLRNRITTGSCLDTGHSEGMVEKSKAKKKLRLLFIRHMVLNISMWKSLRNLIISRDHIYKQTKNRRLTGLDVGENSQGIYTFLGLFVFCFLLCKRKRLKSRDLVRHQKSHCTRKTTGTET